MGREIKRVPLDFDWPLNKIWEGFIMPRSLVLPECQACGGDGYSIEARAVANTFYPHMIGGPNADVLAWCDKIGQAEVDNLVAKGRLRVLDKREPTTDNPRDWEWVSIPRTAQEINTINGRRGSFLDGHDCINRSILVRFRCERLGIPVNCSTCDGHGTIGTSEAREVYENWNGTEPPTGEGWQVWETVSEGSPISPVFKSADALAAWLVVQGYTEEAANGFVSQGYVPSMVITNGVLFMGIESAGLPKT